jgi:hypothetical protein
MVQTFSRFEYALKAAGFHTGEGDANSNWRDFALSVPDIFDNPQEEALKNVVAYILAHPPKKR